MRKEKFVIDDILLLLANSFIFFGIGYSVLRRDLSGEYFLGLFCLGNSLIHGLAGIIINRRKPVDKNLIYLITGLFITFITIALPVQLHGHLITMLWAAEAAVLFWIGRSNKSTICELLTYPVMILAFFSLMIHWPEAYNTIRPMMASFRILFLFNINFLTSLVLIASFSYINIFYFRRPFPSTISESEMFRKIINFILPAMLLTGIYFSFFMEIKCYWNQVAAYGGVGLSENLSDVRVIDGDKYIVAYKVLSVLIYSVVFFSVLSYLNILKFKKRILGLFNLLFNTLVIIFFLTFGLFSLGTLRDNYLLHGLSHYAYPVFMDIGVRYICFLCLGALLYVTYKYMHEDFHGKNFRMEYDLLLHVSILTIASNELINWMDLAGSQSTFKLGLSILFGVYALLLIVLGIWKKKLHLRIGAIVLFSMTLLKLLLYDLTYLNTISKTIVFVILGILLLVISFLYTKYRKVIFEEKN